MAGSEREERAWIRGAQRGSVSDFEALFREHWSRAYRAAYLVVHDAAAAEDIAQEAFLAAVRALDRFDRRRPFGPWLHRIVVNRAIGVKHAAPTLFRLPAPGRLLVESSEGPWVVQPDGSKRLLGRFLDASWSPHGL